jgi:hypothetical protein
MGGGFGVANWPRNRLQLREPSRRNEIIMFTIKLGAWNDPVFELEINLMSVYIKAGSFARYYNLHGLDSH